MDPDLKPQMHLTCLRLLLLSAPAHCFPPLTVHIMIREASLDMLWLRLGGGLSRMCECLRAP